MKTSDTVFKKNIPLTLFEMVVCERELETERNCNILTPTLMVISVVSFSFSRVVNRRPGGPAFCWVLAFSTASCHQRVSKLNRGSQRPLLLGAGFLYHILSSTGLGSKLTDFLSSPSYIIVQSPTQSLEWHVWSSSSGNNCHAVHRSLSSGASVYDCIAGFYLVQFCRPSSPTPM